MHLSAEIQLHTIFISSASERGRESSQCVTYVCMSNFLALELTLHFPDLLGIQIPQARSMTETPAKVAKRLQG